MVRRFVSLDGEVLAEEEWEMYTNPKCFYCNQNLVLAIRQPCPVGFIGEHDWVSLVEPVT